MSIILKQWKGSTNCKVHEAGDNVHGVGDNVHGIWIRYMGWG